MSKMRYSGKQTVLTYSFLRHSSKSLLKLAEENEEGNVHTSMASLILSAFSFEASLNHVGDQLFSFWDSVEKNLSLESKLNFICHELEIKYDFSKRPYQTLRSVFKFRNKLAHGKTETVKGAWSGRIDDTPTSKLETNWQKMCTPKMARMALEDIAEIITEIHKKAGLGDNPFYSIGHGFSVGKENF